MVSKNYVKTSGFFTRTQSVIKALDNISISIKKGILSNLGSYQGDAPNSSGVAAGSTQV